MSANDNFPPGVTGNEYEIAGGEWTVEVRECDNNECNFDGEVDCEYYGTRITWECPFCKTWYEEFTDYDTGEIIDRWPLC